MLGFRGWFSENAFEIPMRSKQLSMTYCTRLIHKDLAGNLLVWQELMTVYNLTKPIVFLLSNFSNAMEKQLQVLQYFFVQNARSNSILHFSKSLTWNLSTFKYLNYPLTHQLSHISSFHAYYLCATGVILKAFGN